MHRFAEIDVSFLICFAEGGVVDVEGALYAGVVDGGVHLWMVLGYGFDDFRRWRRCPRRGRSRGVEWPSFSDVESSFDTVRPTIMTFLP